MQQASLPDGTRVPALGQGTWRMGEDASKAQDEVAALKYGIELGLTLIDIAEMYGEGGAEVVVGQAIAGIREQIFLVSKAYPHNASQSKLKEACERSLKHLNSDYIDLYLLHWKGDIPIEETVAGFEMLKAQGKIRYWGVSNFDVADMEEILNTACSANQVLYNLANRGIEFDLIPWCKRHQMPIMAYSPLGGAHEKIRSHKVLQEIAKKHNATAAQIAIAWTIRNEGIISIPKAVSKQHIKENVAASQIKLTPEDLTKIDQFFKPPKRKMDLTIV